MGSSNGSAAVLRAMIVESVAPPSFETNWIVPAEA
jgi:hypothetical protein